MKTCQFSGLNDEELEIANELYQKNLVVYGFDIWFVGFNTRVEDIQGLLPYYFNEIILLYSGSSTVSNYFDNMGIKYKRITRYCDDAVITHQIQKVLELTEGKRDLNQLKYLSWGKGHIANRFHSLFPNFYYTMVDPNEDDISDKEMKRLCQDVDVVLVNHSHHKFKIEWIIGNKNQHKNNQNDTIIINSSRAGAIDLRTTGFCIFNNIYSDVDGPNAPHLFFDSYDTYNNIADFIRKTINEENY